MHGAVYLDRFPPLAGVWPRLVERLGITSLVGVALGIAVVIGFGHSLSMMLAVPPIYSPVFFPVAGLAAALLTCAPSRLIACVFALTIFGAGLLSFIYFGRSAGAATTHASTLVAVAIALRWVMHVLSPGDVYLRTLRGMIVFLAIAVPVSVLAGACTHALTSLATANMPSSAEVFWRAISGRARSDFIGIVLCYPWMMWLLLGRPGESLTQRRFEGFLQIVACMVASIAAFSWIPITAAGALLIAFAPLPFVLMSALRIGPANASLNLFVALAVLVYMTNQGRGPIVKLIGEQAQIVLGLQAYIVVLALAGQTLGAAALSDRRRARMLLSSEGRYRKFLGLSSEGVWRFEVTSPIPISLPAEEQVELIFERGYLAECNDALARMYGVSSAEELLGVPLRSLLVQDDVRNTEYLLSLIRNNYSLVDAQSHERTIEGKDVFFSNTLVGVVEDGYLMHAWGTQRDITERVKASQVTQQSEARLRTLIESAPHVAYSGYLSDGTIAFWSKGAQRLFGLTELQAIGKGLDALQLSEEGLQLFRTAIKETDRTREPVGPFEWHFQTPSGESKVCFGSIFALDGTDGTRQYVCVDVDVTERVNAETNRRKTEEQLRSVQKLESLGVMAGGIAHDFNNLLVGILGNASLAASQLALDHPASATIRLVQQTSQRAADLTRQLLAYSGKSRITTQLIDVSAVIAGIAELTPSMTKLGLRPRLALSKELPRIHADKTQIEQTILNLIINAAEACESSPSPMVSVFTGVLQVKDPGSERYFPDPPSPGRYITIEVADNGRGIAPADVERMFDPFFSTKFTGRGLGLAVVLGVVRAHRGCIRVKSKVGQGTTFTVLLPLPASNSKHEEEHNITLAPAAALASSVASKQQDQRPPLTGSAVESKQGLSDIIDSDPGDPVGIPASPMVSRGDVTTEVKQPAHTDQPVQQRSGVTVLVVDDDPLVREVLCRSIELIGWATLSAGSPSEALVVIDRDSSISMVVIDITMPDGNGRDLAQVLRGKLPNLTILLSSGYAGESVGDLASCGADGFIAKPFTPTSLLDALLGAVSARERSH